MSRNYDYFEEDYYERRYIDPETKRKIRQAEQKNENLIESLERQRLNFCGIGTNKAKRRLNKFITEDYVANFLRIALEVEDKNISAKKAYGKYRGKIYESKYKLIKKLYEVSVANNIKCGIQETDGPITSHIIYFNMPNTNAQISWHITPEPKDQFIKYAEEWDELENSTLNKLEVEIVLYLSERDLLKDANLTLVEKATKNDDYTVQKFKDRFAIFDKENKMVDDAQGYGYKTIENAKKVIWYKFHGGKQKIVKTKAEARLLIKNRREIAQDIYDTCLAYFKEMARGEITLDDISKWVKEKHSVDVNSNVISEIIEQMGDVIAKEDEIRIKRIKNEEKRARIAERKARQVEQEAGKEIKEQQVVRTVENLRLPDCYDVKILPFEANRFAIYNKRGELFDAGGNGNGYFTEQKAINAFCSNYCYAKRIIALKKEIEILVATNQEVIEYIEELYGTNNQDKIKESVREKYNLDITDDFLETLSILKINLDKNKQIMGQVQRE